jgi:hypothetical protein
MTMDIVISTFSVSIGALASWLVTWFYYRQSVRENVSLKVLQGFQTSRSSEGEVTHVHIPIFEIDKDLDVILHICPDCFNRNTYKKIIFQGADGSREDFYEIGCCDCGYSTINTDMSCDTSLDSSELKRIRKIRKKNAKKRCELGEIRDKIYPTPNSL